MTFRMSEKQRQGLKRFLDRRNLKSRTVSLLKETAKKHALKRGDLTQAENPTYAALVTALEKSIKEGWIPESEFLAHLDQSEIAGRQHVMVFQLPEKGVSQIMDALRSPTSLSTSPTSIAEFLDVPSATTSRLLANSKTEVLLKIVARREYWVSEEDPAESTPTNKWIHKWIEKERAAIILKCSTLTGLFQARLPPREKGQMEAGNAVYRFLQKILEDEFGAKYRNWFGKLMPFELTDAFPAILKNRKDFILRHDTPESETVSGRLTRKCPIKKPKDLRDDPMWKDTEGCARKTLRGHWMCNGELVYAHLNFDEFQLDKATKAECARIFIPHLRSDIEVDNVLQRLAEHLP